MIHHFPPDGIAQLISALFRAVGCPDADAALIADHLVESNLVGHDSHGVIRAAKYIDWVGRGEVLPGARTEIVRSAGPLAVIDGGFGFGQVVGAQAMQEAVARAAAHGFALIAIRNAGHLGRIGAWAEHLARAGLVSVHFVNTSGFGILVAPHGGSDRRLSANPIAAGVPVKGGEPLVLDIATSSIAEGKIQVMRNKRQPLPAATVVDGKGRPTTDAEAFYSDPPGAILPFGGHKGSGLSFFCEILAGSLSGGLASHPQAPTAGRLVNNMLTLAFDPAAFGGTEAFAEDVLKLAGGVKGSPPIEPGGEVLLPGEIEQRTRAQRLAAGVPVDEETWRRIMATAATLGIAEPKI